MNDITQPVRRSVVVPCGPTEAFTLFTEEIHRWWPTATHSVGGGDCVGVTIDPRVGGHVVERLRSGESVSWGTVTSWDPPHVLTMTWHPGYGADDATDVRVSFSDHAGGTLVELVHSGWERLGDGDDMRASYDSGWVTVLTPYVGLAGGHPVDIA